MDGELLDRLAGVSAHSDVAAAMLAAAEPLGAVRMLGGGAEYRALVLLTGERPFAFAVGQREVHVRLDDPSLLIAAETGAGTSFAGPHWAPFVLFRSDYPAVDLVFWLRTAYDRPRHS